MHSSAVGATLALPRPGAPGRAVRLAVGDAGHLRYAGIDVGRHAGTFLGLAGDDGAQLAVALDAAAARLVAEWLRLLAAGAPG